MIRMTNFRLLTYFFGRNTMRLKTGIIFGWETKWGDEKKNGLSYAYRTDHTGLHGLWFLVKSRKQPKVKPFRSIHYRYNDWTIQLLSLQLFHRLVIITFFLSSFCSSLNFTFNIHANLLFISYIQWKKQPKFLLSVVVGFFILLSLTTSVGYFIITSVIDATIAVR